MTSNVRVGHFTMWLEPGPQELAKFKGFAIDPDGFGLDDGVDIRRESVARVQAHGDYDVPGFLTSRTVPYSGWCRAPDSETLLHYRSQITGLLADGSSAVMVVDRPGGSMWAPVRLASMTKFRVRAKTPRVADWQLQLWMADPRLFGDAVTFPTERHSLAEVHHRGNFPALPVLEIKGAATGGYTITGPAGKKYTVTRALVAGQTHRIDMRTGLLEINGVIVMGGVTIADTWAIPPGIHVPHTITAVGGAASLTVTPPDTFI